MRSVAIVLAIAAVGCGDRLADKTPPGPSTPAANSSTAAWSDEFDGAAGARPDSRKWTYDIGNNNGWGNNELQTYTTEARNAHLDGKGHLIIRAESTSAGHTSARIKTRGLLTAQYGRLEARLLVPVGQGLWPAFWMLGTTFNGANWPQCGEIDIMEHVGRDPFRLHSAVHGPGYSGGRGITASARVSGGGKVADEFHVVAVQWEPRSLAFSIDGAVYHRVTPESLPSGAPWVFDQPFFVLLNVAVGGDFPGPPDETTTFPQELVVDYVRYTPLMGATR